MTVSVVYGTSCSFDRAELLACACHAAWYAYTVHGLGQPGEPWDRAPAWQRESMMDAIAFWDRQIALATDRSIDKLREELPRMSHDNWVVHKRMTGWVYGPEKDPDKKTHYCLVPWCDLPREEQAKSIVVVEAYLACLGSIGEIG